MLCSLSHELQIRSINHTGYRLFTVLVPNTILPPAVVDNWPACHLQITIIAIFIKLIQLLLITLLVTKETKCKYLDDIFSHCWLIHTGCYPVSPSSPCPMGSLHSSCCCQLCKHSSNKAKVSNNQIMQGSL